MGRNGVHSPLVNYEPKGLNSHAPPSKGTVSALVNVLYRATGYLRRFMTGPVSQGL
jgi:hypothetical protein